MNQAQSDQAKMELSNKTQLDQIDNHDKIVTTMLIHTWNEHSDIQANKFNANHLHAQHSTNAQYIKYMHLGTKSYKGTRMRKLKENAKHLARSIRK